MFFPVFLLFPTAYLSWISDDGLTDSACTLHTFPCIPGLLKPWPVQHSLIWSHSVSSPCSVAGVQPVDNWFHQDNELSLWIAWNERNSIPQGSFHYFLYSATSNPHLLQYTFPDFCVPQRPAELFIPSWRTFAFKSFLKQSFLLEELSPFTKPVHSVCIARRNCNLLKLAKTGLRIFLPYLLHLWAMWFTTFFLPSNCWYYWPNFISRKVNP